MIRPVGALVTAVVLTVGAGLTACGGGSSEPATASESPTQRSSIRDDSPEPSRTVDPTDSATPSASTAPAPAPAVGPQYVAVGDSFAAAPGVPEVADEECRRSTQNYAQLLAARTGLTVTDLTCTGATTDTALLEQVPEITAEAELVTVGIGGNDFDVFEKTISGCLDLAINDPSGSPCADIIAARKAAYDKAIGKIGTHIAKVLDAIAAAAPDARVVVVGYPDLLPESGSCPDLAPFAPGDFGVINGLLRDVSTAMGEAAADRDLDYVDLTGPSKGHDICSDDPWMNGKNSAPDGTIPFHPFGTAQRAVADLVEAVLEEPASG